MLPKEQIASVRKEIQDLHDLISSKWKQIAEVENTCEHVWLAPKYLPLVVDYDVGCYGGNYVSKRWERECSVCGKKQETHKEKQVSYPDFGD